MNIENKMEAIKVGMKAEKFSLQQRASSWVAKVTSTVSPGRLSCIKWWGMKCRLLPMAMYSSFGSDSLDGASNRIDRGQAQSSRGQNKLGG